ncbi:MAG: hypothetical protein LBQ96_02805 [Fusobacteriaceae bacterium]|jgi:hypothetical protein|nr:hypothetical protein [Fusobacteriaceae bacterium]
MKKLALGLFIVYTVCSFGASDVVLDKEVVGVNKSKLEQKNISKENLTIESKVVDEERSQFISGSKASGEERIKVVERDKSKLTQEVTATTQKKEKRRGGAIKWILGAIGVTAALVVAL